MNPRAVRAAGLLLVLSAATAALSASTLMRLARYASAEPTSSHVLVVPLVVAMLLFWNRDVLLSSISGRSDRAAGLVTAIAGIALSIWAQTGVDDELNRLTLATAGVVVTWLGGFLALFGSSAARASLFPLAFLAFMVPPPGPVIELATGFLKEWSAEAVGGMFTITGTQFYREGFVFTLPGFAIEIADECSGIRSSIALLLTGLLAGHSFLATPWARAALLLAILPVAVLKNAIRIATLSLLSLHVDPSYLAGQLHHEGGAVFFLMALGLLVPVLIGLRQLETLAAVMTVRAWLRADSNAALPD